MELSTKNKSIKLVIRMKRVLDIANALGNANFESGFFIAQKDNNLEALSKIIYILAEDDEGKKPFKSSEDVYDYLDEYRAENKDVTISDIYYKLAEAFNEEGFFNQKMTAEELKEKTSGMLSSINIEDVIKKATEKVVSDIAQEEFRGYKG